MWDCKHLDYLQQFAKLETMHQQNQWVLGQKKSQNVIHGQLVGGWVPPLGKIWFRQLGWLFPIYGKVKNVPNHETDRDVASPSCFSFLFVLDCFFRGPWKAKTLPIGKKQITSNQAMLSNVFSNMGCRSQSNYPSMVFPGYPRWVGTEKELIFDIRNLKCEHCVVF